MALITIKHAKSGKSNECFFSVARLLAVIACILSASAHAAEWKIAPTLEIAETYTDNLRLAVPGAEKSDFVTQISPGISITGTGRGLNVKANYVMQNLAYANERSGIKTNHMMYAQANSELLQDLFFLNGKVGISQTNISPFGPQSVNNINLTDNRAEVRTYSLSPSLQHRFGQTALAQLQYTHDAVDTSTGSLSNTQSARILFSVESGSAFKTWGWGLQGSNQKTDYRNATSTEMESYSANLRYFISPRWSLTATGGYERNNYVAIGEKPAGYFWSTGFAWAPSERTNLGASIGKRFYGDTFAFNASHRTRNTTWSLGYQEDITTTQSQFLVPVTVDTAGFLNQLWKSSIPDAQTREQVVDAFIRNTALPNSLSQAVNTFTNRIFLQKSAHASAALNGAKNTVVFSVFDMRRDAQTASAMDSLLLGSNNVALEDKTHQMGGSIVWNWRLFSRTSFNMSAGYTRVNSVSTGRHDNNKTVRFAVVRQLQPKLKGILELRRLEHESNQGNADFRENAFTASLSMGF